LLPFAGANRPRQSLAAGLDRLLALSVNVREKKNALTRVQSDKDATIGEKLGHIGHGVNSGMKLQAGQISTGTVVVMDNRESPDAPVRTCRQTIGAWSVHGLDPRFCVARRQKACGNWDTAIRHKEIVHSSAVMKDPSSLQRGFRIANRYPKNGIMPQMPQLFEHLAEN
jgi:hypothetical protein